MTETWGRWVIAKRLWQHFGRLPSHLSHTVLFGREILGRVYRLDRAIHLVKTDGEERLPVSK
jgi:hypothetical protein